jgi:predicted nucleic acid-binding protein
MIVIDTDVLIFILRGNEIIKRRFTDLVVETEGYVFITPIQIAEIYAGLREKEKIKTGHFLESFSVIDIDKRVGEVAGVFINRFGKSHNVTMGDSLIGAATKINGFKLWTLNKKHYPMFEEKEFYD